MALVICSISLLSRPVLGSDKVLRSDKVLLADKVLHSDTVLHLDKVLHGNVDYMANLLHGAGLQIESKTFPTTILEVRVGSPAFYGGVCANDKLLSCAVVQDQLAITISRGGKLYALKLRTGEAVKESPTPARPTLPQPKTDIHTNLTDGEIKTLKQSDFVVMVDKSGSMSNRLDDKGTTKWTWCRDHIWAFSQEAASIANKKITLVPFSQTYYVRKDCQPDDILRMFKQQAPGGGTDITTPLSKVLDDYQARHASDPLIVAIITDGEPTAGGDLAETIKTFSRSLSNPPKVKIIFFCIGSDTAGENLITRLDITLRNEGAKYDIVDSYKFAELQRIGLDKALLKSQ
jgi:hypothetical protein